MTVDVYYLLITEMRSLTSANRPEADIAVKTDWLALLIANVNANANVSCSTPSKTSVTP